MRTFDFCLPTMAASVPDHPIWLHELKYDGYRLRLEREGNRVRLITFGTASNYTVAALKAWSRALPATGRGDNRRIA